MSNGIRSVYSKNRYMMTIKTPDEIDKKIKQLSDLEKMYLRCKDGNNNERLKVIQGQIQILKWTLGDYEFTE